MYIGLHVKYPLLSSVELNLNFLDTFSKNTQISNFMKICPVGAEFHANRRTDGRTDMTKLIVTFRNFANVHKKSNSYLTENTLRLHYTEQLLGGIIADDRENQ